MTPGTVDERQSRGSPLIFGPRPREGPRGTRQELWGAPTGAGEGWGHPFRPTYAGARAGHPERSVRTAKGVEEGLWYPTSREKRVRCGAPGFGGEDSAKNAFVILRLLPASRLFE